MSRFDPDGSGLLDMNEFVYELLSPEQRREEQSAIAELLRKSVAPSSTESLSASLQHNERCVTSSLPATARRQVSPLKNKISAFVEPVPKEPIEMNKNLCSTFRSVSSSNFQSPSSQVLCGSDLKTFTGAGLYHTTYKKATEAVDDRKYEVHSRASASRQSLKSSKSSTCLNILRHIGSKLLQRRGGVREFWTAFKFMDLDGSGEVDVVVARLPLLF